MAKPYFTVNGVEMLPFIEAGGLKFTYNDIDAPNSGRTLDGKMHRGRICTKTKVEIKYLPLSTSDSRNILNAISAEYVTVATNIDPKHGTTSYTMYNSTRPATCWVVDKKTGVGKWQDLSASLIEV